LCFVEEKGAPLFVAEVVKEKEEKGAPLFVAEVVKEKLIFVLAGVADIDKCKSYFDEG